MKTRYGEEGFFPNSVPLDHSAMKLNELWDEHGDYGTDHKYHIFLHDVSVPFQHSAYYFDSCRSLEDAKSVIKNTIHPEFKQQQGLVASVIHHPDYDDADKLFKEYTKVHRPYHIDDLDFKEGSWVDHDPGMLNTLIVHAEHVSPHRNGAKPGDIFNHKDMKIADNPYGSLFGNDYPNFTLGRDHDDE